MDPKERDEIHEKFKNKEYSVLLTTNLLARGFDQLAISLVINFDIPFQKDPKTGAVYGDPDTYLHRVGRTGRFDTPGVAINLIEEGKQDREIMMSILEKLENKEVEEMTLTEENMDKIDKLIAQADATKGLAKIAFE